MPGKFLACMPLLRRPSPDTRTLLCPRDQVELDKLERAGVTVDRCPTCRGHWLDAGELRRITSDREVERRATHVGTYAEPTPLLCPRCGAGCMEAFVEEVRVDTCPSCHGVWTDAGEIEEAKRQVQVRRMLSDVPSGFTNFLRHV